jgi:hypothetical protein
VLRCPPCPDSKLSGRIFTETTEETGMLTPLYGLVVFVFIISAVVAIVTVSCLYACAPSNGGSNGSFNGGSNGVSSEKEIHPVLQPPPDNRKVYLVAPEHFRDHYMSKYNDPHISDYQLRFHPAVCDVTQQIDFLASFLNNTKLDNRAHSVFQGDWKDVMAKYGVRHKELLEDDRRNNRLSASPANLKGLVTYIHGKLDHLQQTAEIAKVRARRDEVFEFLLLPFRQLLLALYDLSVEST